VLTGRGKVVIVNINPLIVLSKKIVHLTAELASAQFILIIPELNIFNPARRSPDLGPQMRVGPYVEPLDGLHEEHNKHAGVDEIDSLRACIAAMPILLNSKASKAG
jgi:hypothetical protein